MKKFLFFLSVLALTVSCGKDGTETLIAEEPVSVAASVNAEQTVTLDANVTFVSIENAGGTYIFSFGGIDFISGGELVPVDYSRSRFGADGGAYFKPGSTVTGSLFTETAETVLPSTPEFLRFYIWNISDIDNFYLKFEVKYEVRSTEGALLGSGSFTPPNDDMILDIRLSRNEGVTGYVVNFTAEAYPVYDHESTFSYVFSIANLVTGSVLDMDVTIDDIVFYSGQWAPILYLQGTTLRHTWTGTGTADIYAYKDVKTPVVSPELLRIVSPKTVMKFSRANEIILSISVTGDGRPVYQDMVILENQSTYQFGFDVDVSGMPVCRHYDVFVTGTVAYI